MNTTLVYAEMGILAAAQPVQTDVAVAVQGNRIVATGTLSALRETYPDAQLVGGKGCFLLPAFTNSHDHGRAFGTASLGIPDDLLEIWLPGLSALPSIPQYLAGAWEGIQLLKSGVSLTAHSHNPPAWEAMLESSVEMLRGYQAAGIRVAFHPPMVDQNPLVYTDAAGLLASLPDEAARKVARRFMQPVPLSRNDYLQICSALHQQFHNSTQQTIHLQISPAGGQWCSDELILASVEFARAHNTRVQMHMLETRYQQLYAHKRWGKSFVQHLDEIGALGTWITFAHMVYVDEVDLPLLAERGVGIAHNPSSNLRLRSGVAPVAEMLAAGIQVGLGLDGHALDDDQDFLREMRLAYTLANRAGASSLPVEPHEILQMATLSGAHITLGEDVPLGRLANGALADLVLLDWGGVRGRWAPEGYPAAEHALPFLLHRSTRQHVRHVMVNGAWVVRDGQCITLDETAIADAIREALAQQMTDAGRTERLHAAQALAPYLRRFYALWD